MTKSATVYDFVKSYAGCTLLCYDEIVGGGIS